MAAVLQVINKAMAQMSNGSLLRRSLVLTAALVTLAAVWVSIVSIVLVSVVDRTFDGGSRASAAATSGVPGKAPPVSEARRSSSAGGPSAPAKPNG